MFYGSLFFKLVVLFHVSTCFQFTPPVSFNDKPLDFKPKGASKHRPSFHKGQNKKKQRTAISMQEKKVATARMQKGNFDARCAKESEYFWGCVRDNTALITNRSLQLKKEIPYTISLKFDLREPLGLVYDHAELNIRDIKGQGTNVYVNTVFGNIGDNENVSTMEAQQTTFQHRQAVCLITCFRIKSINGAPMSNHENITRYTDKCRERGEKYAFIQLVEVELGCFARNKTMLSLFPHSYSKLCESQTKNRKATNRVRDLDNDIQYRNIKQSVNNIEEKCKAQIVDTGVVEPLHSPSPLTHFKDLIDIIKNVEYRSDDVNLNKYRDATLLSDHQIPLSHLFDNLQRLEFEKTTIVQSHCIPLALQELDILACAETGSGKTMAYLLPILSSLFVGRGPTKQRGPDRLPKERPGVEGRPWCLSRARRVPVRPAALILAPTRELAQQIEIEAKKLTFDTPSPLSGAHSWVQSVYGGAKTKPQLNKLALGVEILVATPGRLLDFMQQKVISLDRCRFLVLDEADRMLEEGFEKELNSVVQSDLPEASYRQTFLFSATFAPIIRKVAAQVLRPLNHVHVTIGSVKGHVSHSVKQSIVPVFIPSSIPVYHTPLNVLPPNGTNDINESENINEEGSLHIDTVPSSKSGIIAKNALKRKTMDKMVLIRAGKLGTMLLNQILDPSEKTIIFVSTKRRATWLARQLNGLKLFGGSGDIEPIFRERSELNSSLNRFLGVRLINGQKPGKAVVELHGDLTQRMRDTNLECFKRGDANVLVSTDVASRGIDIQAVDHVIQFDLPTSRDKFHSYIHRVGRSGRAGARGKATALYVLPIGYMSNDPILKSPSLDDDQWKDQLDHTHISHFEDIDKLDVASSDESFDDMVIFRDLKQLISESDQKAPHWFSQLNELVRHSHGGSVAQSRIGAKDNHKRMSLGYKRWIATKSSKNKQRKWDPRY